MSITFLDNLRSKDKYLWTTIRKLNFTSNDWCPFPSYSLNPSICRYFDASINALTTIFVERIKAIT